MTAPPDDAPLAGQSFTLTGQAPALDHARLLLESLGATITPQAQPHASQPRVHQTQATSTTALDDTRLLLSAADWAASGAMALTGPAEGPPALAPGAPASALAGALTVFELLTRA